MTRPPAHHEGRAGDPDDTWDDPGFVPLDAEQARRLRERNPSISPWWIVAGQVVSGLAGALIAWIATGRLSVGISLLYGAMAVAVPAGLYARAVARGAGFLGWELAKIALTVALLAAAPRMVSGLSWLALLVGVILATKMYWVALAWVRRPRRTGN